MVCQFHFPSCKVWITTAYLTALVRMNVMRNSENNVQQYVILVLWIPFNPAGFCYSVYIQAYMARMSSLMDELLLACYWFPSEELSCLQGSSVPTDRWSASCRMCLKCQNIMTAIGLKKGLYNDRPWNKYCSCLFTWNMNKCLSIAYSIFHVHEAELWY